MYSRYSKISAIPYNLDTPRNSSSEEEFKCLKENIQGNNNLNGFFKQQENNELENLYIANIDKKIEEFFNSNSNINTNVNEKCQFQEALTELAIQLKNANNLPAPFIKTITDAVITLLTELTKATTKEDQINAIKIFENSCKQESGWKKLVKAILTVIIAAVGLVMGLVLGGTIGLAAGAWAGPGAIVSSIVSAMKGSITGATLGLAIGAGATSITASIVGGYLLFKPNKISKSLAKIIHTSQNLALLQK